jgi:hypothetical protein
MLQIPGLETVPQKKEGFDSIIMGKRCQEAV